MNQHPTNLTSLGKRIYDHTLFVWAELLILYLVFPLLIVFNIIELRFRWILFAIIFVYVGGMLWRRKPDLQEIGISRSSFATIIKWCSIYSLGVTVICLVLYMQDYLTLPDLLFYLVVLIIYPIISAPAQEIFFRSFFFYRYSELSSPYVVGVLNIVLFAFYHKMYGGWLAVWLSLVGGIILTVLYMKSRNYWWVWICHGFLGVLVFVSGLGKHFTDLIR